MDGTYTLCTRNVRDVLLEQLGTEQFDGEFNYTPYQQYNSKGKRMWSNLMSGSWAWKKAVMFFFVLSLRSISDTFIGCHCKRSKDTGNLKGCHACACHLRIRQDDRIGGYRTPRISSRVRLCRQHHQHCQTLSWKRRRTIYLPTNS
jgi:hypothetical protein